MRFRLASSIVTSLTDMDSKEIKNHLKKSKEAIKNKDIPLALNLCKAILKEDRNNYLALVLLGAALQESDQKDQAPNAYRKAIEVSQNQILAWQGLAAFYEKTDVSKNAKELLSVYQRLLQLESDSTKWCDIVFKIHPLIKTLQSDEITAEIVEEHKLTEDQDRLNALQKLVIHCLSQSEKISEQSLVLFEDFLNSSGKNFENGDHIQVYFNLWYKKRNIVELLSNGEKLLLQDNRNPVVNEWMCKVCSEEFVDNRVNAIHWCNKLPQYYSSLLEANKDNVLALMAQGAYFIFTRAFLEAKECLQHCLSLNRGLFHAICLIAEANLHLLCLDQAQLHAQTAMQIYPENIFAKTILAKALSISEDRDSWKKAVTLGLEVSTVQDVVSELLAEGLCEAYLRLELWPELLSASKQVALSPTKASFYRLEGEAKGQRKLLLNTLSTQTPDCPEAWNCLGSLYMAEDAFELACTSFLKCAKLAPHWFTAYHQLGNLYTRSPATLDKARRCYQRALVLNPRHVASQIALSDTFHALGDAHSNLLLLERICQTADGKWAWSRLGLQYLDMGDSTAAINSLRSALKTDPTNSHLWEALADAYLARGANDSALKSYQRVIELKPGSFYSALQIATIKQITELPEESLIEFRELVEQQPSSILALKGICETCICIAKKFLNRRLLGLARDRLQEGLVAISRALQIRPDVACFWKLAGDCLTLAGNLPRSWHFLQVPQVLMSKQVSDQTMLGLELLELGARCLCRCLKLMGDFDKSLVWHDLALNYMHQAKHSTGDSSSGLCQKALAAAKESVTCNPKIWQHWNQLGVVSALSEIKNYALAQHSFIKATMVDETVAVPWSNLGFLYLMLRELKLANSAFSCAQRIDSEYCSSWVGQALIAELIDNIETMDLFRHSTQLGYHSESSIGYAQWVCHTLQECQDKRDPHYIYSIEKMHAVPTAIDTLTWATEENEDNACGLNMLGCLLERCNLYRTSVEVLSRAVEHCPTIHRDKVLANFGRVLVKAGKTDDAVQVYKAISKADIHSQCGLALALYKGKQYKEAFEAYEAALNWWAADDAVKAQLYVAMATTAYKMDGPDQAKTLLLQGNQLKPTSVHGLFAACSLGMLNGDLELSKLALKDLLKYQNELEYVSDVALFQSFIKFIQGDIQESVWSMSKTVQRQPSVAALWLQLALLIVNKQSSGECDHKVAVAAQCARTAITLGRTYMDVSKVLAVVSLSQLMAGQLSKALSASQHALHLYPDVGESWAVLTASCHTSLPPTQLRALISHARQNIDLERTLAKWMSNFERKVTMIPTV